MSVRIRASRSIAGDIAHIFGTSLEPADEALSGQIEADVIFQEPGAARSSEHPTVPHDSMILRHGYPRAEIHTDTLSVIMELDRSPAVVHITVLRCDTPHFDFCVHLAVVFHKLLFLMDRVVLHAAAIKFAGRGLIVLGDKGAGKSTLALSLAHAGGTVLGEDHVIVRRSDSDFLVSGCDERWRVDEKTESHFFAEPLKAIPQDFAGRMKKEVSARGLFLSKPYVDDTAQLIFFARAGSEFRITPLPRQVALLRLIEAVGKLQRFVDAADRARFLEMLSDFVATVEPYDLQLSPNLADLTRLQTFLRTGVDAAPSPRDGSAAAGSMEAVKGMA